LHPFSFSNTEIISESKKVYNNIESTEGQILHYIIWENFEKNKNLVIQCSKSLVYIYDIFAPIFNLIKIEDNKLKGYNYSCTILYNKNNTDILCILNEKGNIIFYDLFKNKITFIVNINDDHLVQICQFNEKYLIILSKNGFFTILDYNNKKIISKILSKEMHKCQTMKLLNHCIYGKYILIGGFRRGTKIYKNCSNFFNHINKRK